MAATNNKGDAQHARDQEQIAHVDAAIAETIDALRVGRNAVARGVYQQYAINCGEESGRPGDLIKAGRHQVVNQLSGAGERFEPSTATDILSKLTHQLSACLLDLTSEVPRDRVGRLALESRLHAALRAYTGAVRMVLHPLAFERPTVNDQQEEEI
jgi:hypothetical protein